MGNRGPKPLSPDEHRRRGTFRTDRHGEQIDERQVVSEAARKATLTGLPPTGKAVAVRLLDTYWNFDASALFTLRAYAFSCERLSHLQLSPNPDHQALLAETTTHATLLRALSLPTDQPVPVH
jgi:hypothetical protein